MEPEFSLVREEQTNSEFYHMVSNETFCWILSKVEIETDSLFKVGTETNEELSLSWKYHPSTALQIRKVKKMITQTFQGSDLNSSDIIKDMSPQTNIHAPSFEDDDFEIPQVIS